MKTPKEIIYNIYKKDCERNINIKITNGLNTCLLRNYKKECVLHYKAIYDTLFLLVKGMEYHSYKLAILHLKPDHYTDISADEIPINEYFKEIRLTESRGIIEDVDNNELKKFKDELILREL